MATTEQLSKRENIWDGVSSFENPLSLDSIIGTADEENAKNVDASDTYIPISEAAEFAARLEIQLNALKQKYPDSLDPEISDQIEQLSSKIDFYEDVIKTGGTTNNLNSASLMAAMGDTSNILGQATTVNSDAKTEEEKKKLKTADRSAANIIKTATAAASLPLIYEFFDRDTALNLANSSFFEGPFSIENTRLQAADTVFAEKPELLTTLSTTDQMFHATGGPQSIINQKEAAFNVAIEEAYADGSDESLARAVALETSRDTFMENSNAKLLAMKIDDPTTEAGQAAISQTLAKNPGLVVKLGGENAAKAFLEGTLADGNDVSLALNENELTALGNELSNNPTDARRTEIETRLTQNELMIEHIGTMTDDKVKQAISLEADLHQQGVTPDIILDPDKDPGLSEIDQNLNAEQSHMVANGVSMVSETAKPSRRVTEVEVPFDQAEQQLYAAQYRKEAELGKEYVNTLHANKEEITANPQQFEVFRSEYKETLVAYETEKTSEIDALRAQYGLPPTSTPTISETQDQPNFVARRRSKISPDTLGPVLGKILPEDNEPSLGPVISKPKPLEIWEDGYIFDPKSFDAQIEFQESLIASRMKLADDFDYGAGKTEELLGAYAQDVAAQKAALQENIRSLLAEKLADQGQDEMSIAAVASEAATAAKAAAAQGVIYNPKSDINLDASITLTGTQNEITTGVMLQAAGATADLSTSIEELLAGNEMPATTAQTLDAASITRT